LALGRFGSRRQFPQEADCLNPKSLKFFIFSSHFIPQALPQKKLENRVVGEPPIFLTK